MLTRFAQIIAMRHGLLTQSHDLPSAGFAAKRAKMHASGAP
jgi:hypothetical protein